MRKIRLAKQYQMDIEKIKGIMSGDQLENLRQDIKMQKSVKYIAEQAKEV